MLNPATQLAIELTTILYKQPDQLYQIAELHKLTNGIFTTKYVEMILGRLKRNEIIRSVRGPKGGYQANKQSVTLLEIVQGGVSCSVEAAAMFGKTAEEVQQGLNKYLESKVILAGK